MTLASDEKSAPKRSARREALRKEKVELAYSKDATNRFLAELRKQRDVLERSAKSEAATTKLLDAFTKKEIEGTKELRKAVDRQTKMVEQTAGTKIREEGLTERAGMTARGGVRQAQASTLGKMFGDIPEALSGAVQSYFQSEAQKEVARQAKESSINTAAVNQNANIFHELDRPMVTIQGEIPQPRGRTPISYSVNLSTLGVLSLGNAVERAYADYDQMSHGQLPTNFSSDFDDVRTPRTTTFRTNVPAGATPPGGASSTTLLGYTAWLATQPPAWVASMSDEAKLQAYQAYLIRGY